MRRAKLALSLLFGLGAAAACAATGGKSRSGAGAGGSSSGGGSGGSSQTDSGQNPDVLIEFDGTPGDGAMLADSGGRDPKTCAEAEQFRTYLGCTYFPTVLGNVVSPAFDYAVVVANPTDEAADVHVDGPNGFTSDTQVAPHQLATLYLPWVDALKGSSLTVANACTSEAFDASIVAPASAYRLTSTRPVAAYQFSPLEFRAAGGPAGKTWSCNPNATYRCECNSYSNDASLLLPKNALTSNYTAFTWRGNAVKPVYIAITATEDATTVTVQLGPNAQILAGPANSGIPAGSAGDVFEFTIDSADVVELVAATGADLSGTLVQAADEKPIQVMAGSQSATVPDDQTPSSDHLEEIVFPAEAVGKDYVVVVPTGPYGEPVQHVVRLYGHASATTLSYYPAKPAGAPDTLAPASSAEFVAASDFQVVGSEPFAVGSFLVGGSLLDPEAPPTDSAGDPSQSLTTSVPQYRDKYVFLAPVDYESNYVDIVSEHGVTVTLDGTALDPASATTLDGRGPDGVTPLTFDIYRVPLDAGPLFLGAHELVSETPVGIQVTGYGRFTSYVYPGGLNLNLIAEPIPPPH